MNYTSAPVEWGKIDAASWGYPDWVDPEVAKEGVRKQGDAAIMYGGMESYHHMCRFYSGYVHLEHDMDFLLTVVLDFSTSTSYYRSTSGTGG